MNVYLKNYGIWVGGPMAFLFIIGYLNILPYEIGMILDYLVIIGGTITGTAVTHKELGQNIQFGKAIGPVLLFIGAFSVISIIMTIISWGVGSLEYFLPVIMMSLFIKLIIGTSILLATGTWYMFVKAGQPGWAFLIPIYNIIVMLEIAKKPTWWIAMMFVPIANIVFLIMMFNGISINFGKDSGFTVGLVFLRQIFFAVLGFGPAVYVGATAVNSNDDSVIDNM